MPLCCPENTALSERWCPKRGDLLYILYYAQITKVEVDSFGEGKMIPCCQLVAKCEGELTDLMHSVQLKGAKVPYNVFLICVHRKAALKLMLVTGTYIMIFYHFTYNSYKKKKP